MTSPGQRVARQARVPELPRGSPPAVLTARRVKKGVARGNPITSSAAEPLAERSPKPSRLRLLRAPSPPPSLKMAPKRVKKEDEDYESDFVVDDSDSEFEEKPKVRSGLPGYPGGAAKPAAGGSESFEADSSRLLRFFRYPRTPREVVVTKITRVG